MLYRWFYNVLWTLLLPLVFIRLLWKSRKNAAYRARWLERLGRVPFTVTAEKRFWVHAVSVGEVLASVPLIKALQQTYPDAEIILTTMTPTGSARIKASFGNSIFHMYLPYELPFALKHFLKTIRPSVCIIMETEIWPNLFYYTHQHGIPCMIANARLSDRSYAQYARFPRIMRWVLSMPAIIATHSQEDKARFINLGAPADRVQAVGSVKFDMRLPEGFHEKLNELHTFLSLGQRPVWIAASTHDGEEKIVLAVHKKLLTLFPTLVLILAPRHPDRAPEIEVLLKEAELAYIKRSDKMTVPKNISVFWNNELGDLLLYYGLSQVAFVGGSLISRGGHNVLEPLIVGVAPVTGFSYENFREITGLLRDKKAVYIVNNETELYDTVTNLLQSPAERESLIQNGQAVIAENRGSVVKHIALLSTLIK